MNAPKYETRWKRSTTGQVRSYKREVKLSHLHCFACNKKKALFRFPAESGYGSKTTPQTACGVCLNKRAFRKDAIPFYLKRDRLHKGIPIKQQVMSHYGGKCHICGVSDSRMLSLYHYKGRDRHYRTVALGSKNRNHLRNYYFWLKTHQYPSEHQQLVLCLNCHVLHEIQHPLPKHREPTVVPPKRIPKKAKVVLPEGPTDREKMLDMFGMTEADL